MTSLVVRKVISGGMLRLRLVPVMPRVLSEGVVKLEQVRGICPACGQQVEAVARDGHVKGYCAVARQSVDFLVKRQGVHLTAETRAKISATHTGKHPTAETKAKLSASLKRRWQDPEYRAKQVATHT